MASWNPVAPRNLRVINQWFEHALQHVLEDLIGKLWLAFVLLVHKLCLQSLLFGALSYWEVNSGLVDNILDTDVPAMCPAIRVTGDRQAKSELPPQMMHFTHGWASQVFREVLCITAAADLFISQGHIVFIMEINVSMVHQDGMLPNVTDSCDGRFQTLQPDSLFETEMPKTNYISDFVNQRFSSLRLSHASLSFPKPGRSSQNHWWRSITYLHNHK